MKKKNEEEQKRKWEKGKNKDKVKCCFGCRKENKRAEKGEKKSDQFF